MSNCENSQYFRFWVVATVSQTEEDCWLPERCCRDQAEDVHPLHRVLATGTVCIKRVGGYYDLLSFCSFNSVCLCVIRRWASCSSLTTSQTAWSTSPRWWTTFGSMPETGPQTWVDPVTLDPLLLPLPNTPSCPPFITTLTISGPPPPRLLPPRPPTPDCVPAYARVIDVLITAWLASAFLHLSSQLQLKSKQSFSGSGGVYNRKMVIVTRNMTKYENKYENNSIWRVIITRH